MEDVTPNIEITYEINENGKYYIWIKDSADNTEIKEVQIDKADNTPPEISYILDTTTLSQGFVTINVTAEDSESGLYDSPFSWDQTIWSIENATRQVTQNGRYKVYAEDNLGNISELEIVVDCFPQEGTAELGEGDIISSITVSADWNNNVNNNVEITLNKDLDIVAWQITVLNEPPNNYIEVSSNNNNNNQNNPEDNTNNTTDNNTTNENTINNSTSENNTNTNREPDENTSFPNNVVINVIGLNKIYKYMAPLRIAEVRQTPIIINMPLQTNTTYYLWVKDSSGNVRCQTFTISKAII